MSCYCFCESDMKFAFCTMFLSLLSRWNGKEHCEFVGVTSGSKTSMSFLEDSN